jgi:hypothetical protein
MTVAPPKPGEYFGLPMAAYLAMPAVSASLLQAVIDECPYAAWYRSWMNPNPPDSVSTPVQNNGTIAHGILLEGSIEKVAVFDLEDHPNEKGGGFATGWTNKSIKAARDAAIAEGKTPVLREQFREIEAMVAAAREYIESLRHSEPAIWRAFQPGGGESEITMVWDDDGVLCRARPDRITVDRDLFVDYKTGGTTAEPDTWGRTQMVRMGYYTSAAHYRNGARALWKREPPYVYLVQEQEAPYLCSLVGIDPQGHELGARKIRHGMGTWRGCLATGKWPKYPTRVCYPEIPAWETTRWEEREGEEQHGIPYDPGKLWGDVKKAQEYFASLGST